MFLKFYGIIELKRNKKRKAVGTAGGRLWEWLGNFERI
jgi:hypothetical protein